MPNIYLTSGGFNTIKNFVSEENIELFKELAKGQKVIIIANAAPESSGNYVARENVKENFLNAGAIQVDVVDLDKDNVGLILDYDIIYMLGGDLQYLIKLNKETDFRKMLINFLERGIYIGESAGSMILADDVKWAYEIKKGTKPKYDVELDSYAGLNLVDYYIFPHFQKTDQAMKDKIKAYEKEHGIRITELNDGEIITYNY